MGNDDRTETFRFRANAKELEMIEAVATEMRCTASEAVRALVVDAYCRLGAVDIVKAMWRDLGVPSSLNDVAVQLAARTGKPPSMTEIEEVLEASPHVTRTPKGFFKPKAKR